MYFLISNVFWIRFRHHFFFFLLVISMASLSFGCNSLDKAEDNLGKGTINQDLGHWSIDAGLDYKMSADAIQTIDSITLDIRADLAAPDICIKSKYYIDCDGDDLALATVNEVLSCGSPKTTPKGCKNPAIAKWTTTEPKNLKTTDCDDADPLVGAAVTWYADCDGDGFSANYKEFQTSCSKPSAPTTCLTSNPIWTTVEPKGFDADCDDKNKEIFPQQMKFFSDPIPNAAPGMKFDYNCDGLEEKETTKIVTVHAAAKNSPLL